MNATTFPILLFLLIVRTPWVFAVTPGDAPQLPITGERIVNIASVSELNAAMGNLQDGDTLLLADGTYPLTSSLYINNRHDVTIRGTSGSTGVTLAGRGMNNPDHNGVPFGIWSNSTNTTIAHLTIRDTWDNEILFNSGAQSPHVYSVRLVDSGSQFIKSNPTDVNAGLGVNDGIVEYCVFEYTGTPPDDHGAGVGYFNGISAHAADNWIVRGNLFRNLHNPDGTAYPWNPSVLFWRNSSNTVTERNTFINVDRAVAYGLENSASRRDHSGGAIRNNFVYLEPGFFSPERRASSDGSLIAWNSPGTRIDHNTVLANDNVFFAIQFRFAGSADGTARNNLSDAPVHLRDGASALLAGNLDSASTDWFVAPGSGDLHLKPGVTEVIDQAEALEKVTEDIDGERRPRGASADIGADEFFSTAEPVIDAFMKEADDFVFRFQTLLGVEYDVQQASDVLEEDWSLATMGIVGDGLLHTFRDTNGANQDRRYYRVRVTP